MAQTDVLVTWNGSVLLAARTSAPEAIIGAFLTRSGPLGTEGSAVEGDLRVEWSRAGALERGRKTLDGVGPVAVALGLHAALLAVSSIAPRPDPAEAERERMDLLKRYVTLAADTDAKDRADLDVPTDTKHEPVAVTEEKTKVPVLAKAARSTPPKSESDESRAAALEEATEFGMIGLLASGRASSDAPATAWGSEIGPATGNMWGSEIGDSFGSAGLGMSGTGEGGGGRGEGIGLGSLGTIGHGAGTGSGAGFGAGRGRGYQGPSNVRAGEWDDNANYREFRRFLGTQKGMHWVDVSNRQFIVVKDSNGHGIPNCDVEVSDGPNTVTLRTMANGRAILFPNAEGLGTASLVASARCGGNAMTASFAATHEDGVVNLDGAEPRTLDAVPAIDVGFALDTTGSMAEEIGAVQATLQKVAASIKGARVNVGLVEYRDRGDDFVTRVFPMTTDLVAFRLKIGALSAGGGGDMPESVNQGIHDTLTKLAWRSDAVARLMFVIGDAPPHLDYANDSDYATDMRSAAHRGIQTYTIAASGMDDLGQVVFRQVAQYTGGTEIFVLRGGAGPDSVGGGDPLSSCGGTQTQYRSSNLDHLIVEKINAATKALDADPAMIAGLGKDVGATTCSSAAQTASNP